MKKIYSAPEIKVERFDVEDIVTVSVGLVVGAVTGTGEGGSGVYEIMIETQW